MTGLCCCICGPSHKKLPNVTRSPSLLHSVRLFRTYPPPWLTSITFITTRVSGVPQPRNNTGWSLLHMLQPTQNIIYSCEQQVCVKMRTNTRIMRVRTKLCCLKPHEGKKTLYAAERNNTNSSQSGQEFAPAPQHTQIDINSLAGDLSH